MKHKILFLPLFIVNCSLSTGQKLPTYAIRTQYRIDGIRDTLGAKAGGAFMAGDVYTDSIIFHYNSQGLLGREQIFRTVTYYSDPNTISSVYRPDSSYYYRQHRYDGQGRKVSIRHYVIEGNISSLDYGKEYLMRTDSMAYDGHGSQLFHRRYEPYDFERGDLTMVVKSSNYLEYEFTYDSQGRIATQKNYSWDTNIRRRTGLFPAEPDYSFSYTGNTNKLRARRYREKDGTKSPIVIDTLFNYDSQGRITSYKQVPCALGLFNLGNYDYGCWGLMDTIIYLDAFGSKEWYASYVGKDGYFAGSLRMCGGEKRDERGNLRFPFKGIYGNKSKNIGIGQSENCYDTLEALVPIKNNLYGIDGNILALDSAYLFSSYGAGYYENQVTNFYYDTVAYYGFKTLDEILALREENLVKEVENAFVLYPNPAKLWIYVVANKRGTLTVSNMDGTVLYTAETDIGKTQLGVSSLSSGLYMVTLNGVRRKLVIR